MKTREDLTRTTRAYWPARAILTGVELGVFRALGRRKLSANSVAKRIGADPRTTELLLDALVGQDVLTKAKTSYAIKPALVPFLTDGPESALGMMTHHARLWEAWSRLTEAVRSGRPVREAPSFRRGPEDARAFTYAMRDGAVRFAPAVAAELPLRGVRHLLDLGGGPGIYSVEIARRFPDLSVTVVDLANVAAVGREIVAEYPDVRDRIRYAPADIGSDPLPEGADAALLSHVIHGESEEGVRGMFRRIADALPKKGGRLIVRDFFLSPDRTEPPGASLFSLNMLVATRGGRSYSAKECTDWLREMGFARVTYRRSKAAPDTGYLEART
jgi:hypothetical protein